MSFLFERDFDLELEQERASREPKPASEPSDEAVEQAIEQARQEGFERGLAAGREEVAQEAAHRELGSQISVLEKISDNLRDLLETDTIRGQELERQVLSLLQAVAEKLIPELALHHSQARIEREILDAIRLAMGSSKLRILVAPTRHLDLANMIDAEGRRLGFTDRLQVVAEPSMIDGEARVEWDSGFLEYSYPQICDRVLNVIRGVTNPSVQMSTLVEEE